MEKRLRRPRHFLSVPALLLGLAALAFSALRPDPVPAQTRIAYPATTTIVGGALATEIVNRLEEENLGSDVQLGIHVVRLGTGVTVLELNSDVPVKVGSLVKLATTGAALDILGAEHVFETSVEYEGSLEGGRLRGNLVIRGGGDPSLGPRFTRNRSDVTGMLNEWAREIRRAGIQTIAGNIVGDDSRYTYDPLALGWEPTEIAEWYSAEVAALNYNDNVVDIVWRGGRQPEDPVRFELIPNTKYVNFSHSVRTGSRNLTEKRVRYFRFREGNDIRARGRIPIGAEIYDFAAVHDPARYTAHLLMEELRRRGVTVEGGALSERDREGVAGSEAGEVLIRHESPPLRELLPVVNGNSQNLYAEVLLREIALRAGEPATFRGGAKALTDWLIAEGLHRNGFLAVDGSGLSPVNRMPPRMVANILQRFHNRPDGSVYRASLARPGAGSLRTRFQDEAAAPLSETLRAKTGYLAGTHAIAGYLTSAGGEEYAYVVVINGYNPYRSSQARDFMDWIVVFLHDAADGV